MRFLYQGFFAWKGKEKEMMEPSEDNEVAAAEQALEVVQLYRRREEIRGFPIMLGICTAMLGMYFSSRYPSYANYLVIGGILLGFFAYRWGRPIADSMQESASYELSDKISSGGQSLREALCDLSIHDSSMREIVEQILRTF